MDAPTTLRTIALKLLEGDTAESASQAAALLKTASDIEQQQANTAKLDSERKKVEQDLDSSHHRIKDMLTAATPLVTTLILVGTLVFQMIEARRADQEKVVEAQQKRDDSARLAEQAEQARFTDALKTIQAAEKISPAATLLNTFTTEPYKAQARQMAVKLLLRAPTIDDFKDTFSATLEPVTAADMPILLQLDRATNSAYNRFLSNFADPFTHQPDLSRMKTREQQDENNRLGYAISVLSEKIGGILLQRAKTDDSPVDLTDASISNVDLTGVNLRHAKLTRTAFTMIDLQSADLGGVEEFGPTYFFSTAWWRAARIHPKLLSYLEQAQPYQENISYKGLPATPQEYQTNLARLHTQAVP